MTGLRSKQRIHEGDCLEVMAGLGDASVDAVVTDPPYGIGFMGREWDSFSPTAVAARSESIRRKGTTRTSETWPGKLGEGSQGAGVAIVYDDKSAGGNRRFQAWCEQWAAECLRVLKPGGHFAAFGGTRTHHRLVAGVEDAGFEIRDSLIWLFGSGFPKSRDVGEGRGTALKPGHEPIVLARKPFSGSVAVNVHEHGTGALNIDACRLASPDGVPVFEHKGQDAANCYGDGLHGSRRSGEMDYGTGRWPANVALDEDAAAALDEQSGQLVSGANPTRRGSDKFRDVYGTFAGQTACEPARGVDVGGASRFYYCAKTDPAERHAGLAVPTLLAPEAPEANNHPTVKPIDLMRWLVRLVTPPAGILLDPFLGSGTTAIAAVLEGRDYIGIEREPEYLRIAEARLAYWTMEAVA